MEQGDGGRGGQDGQRVALADEDGGIPKEKDGESSWKCTNSDDVSNGVIEGQEAGMEEEVEGEEDSCEQCMLQCERVS